MTNQEAKFTLSAYRANGQDAGDPAFAEALAQAKQDPALGAWLARAQAQRERRQQARGRQQASALPAHPRRGSPG